MPPVLKLGTGSEVINPSPEELEQALRSLPGGDGSFAILERNNLEFMQVAGGGEAGFEMLEYVQGRPHGHFQCFDGLERERVIRAFLSYREGRDDHKQQFKWEPLKGIAFPGFDKVIKIATLVIIAGLAWIFLRALLR